MTWMRQTQRCASPSNMHSEADGEGCGRALRHHQVCTCDVALYTLHVNCIPTLLPGQEQVKEATHVILVCCVVGRRTCTNAVV